VHNLVVDAYAMQHAEEYCKSAKSYVTHLTALCCALEVAGDPKLYWGIARWLDGPTTLGRPADITPRGTMTIADVKDASDGDYAHRVRAWAADVWGAYRDQHAAARRWLEEVRRHVGAPAGVRGG
jgi:hypothetical protein